MGTEGLLYLDLRSNRDGEFGDGEEIERNTFVIPDGYEKGLVQHFFDREAVDSLLDGKFKILHMELDSILNAPNYDSGDFRWNIEAVKT